jgi:transposase-like protein
VNPNPFRYFNSSPEVIRRVVTMYIKYPLSLRDVEDLLSEGGSGICYGTASRSDKFASRSCQPATRSATSVCREI